MRLDLLPTFSSPDPAHRLANPFKRSKDRKGEGGAACLLSPASVTEKESGILAF